MSSPRKSWNVFWPPSALSSVHPYPEHHAWEGRNSSLGLLGRSLFCVLLLLISGVLTLSPRALFAQPLLFDDADRAGLVDVLAESISYLQTRPKSTFYRFGKQRIPATHLLATARHLQHLARNLKEPAAFQQRLSEDFEWLSLAADTAKPVLVTGYYRPVFPGSLSPHPPYLYPLYRKPVDLVVQSASHNKTKVGRLVAGHLTPYWTRKEIESGRLLQGQELVWLRDPFDAFTLHVQGSGIVQFEDGSLHGVHYAARNGQPYTSIGRYLVQSGRMELAQVNMESIRNYLLDHPQETDLILQQNQSYIFFDWDSPGPAVGSLNRGLTAGRSVAADQRLYPPGSVLWLQCSRPVVRGKQIQWQPLNRLVSVQDSGSAIVGAGRLDLFWGTGRQAGLEAGRMRSLGQVQLLLIKERGR